MTNAPIILTQDCDMYSNDPQTPKKALCYISDPLVRPTLGFVQFPQRYHGLNKDDIYGGEFLRLFPITTRPIIELAHHVAGCNYENNTKWGFQIGFRYGSLVEDYFTGYRLQCEGWKSIFCHPSRPAFLGDVPISIVDAVSQTKRWAIGLLEVAFSKYTPVSFGARCMGYIMSLCYTHYAFWPIWSIPITIYSFVPQIALLNGLYIFPKVTEPCFLLYVFLFLGAYGQDLYDFILFDSTYKRWWNDQRICKRYDQGLMEFGVHSAMFVPLTTASIVNLFALITGMMQTLNLSNFDKLFVQLFLAGFGIDLVYAIMEIKNASSRVNELRPSSNYDELLLKHSLLFADGLKELRDVKEQLYSAAEHFEDSYYKNDEKEILLESLKNYISKSLIKTIDHLGSVTYKVSKFLDENVNEVSRTKLRVLCIEQRIQTCQAYVNHSGLTQQSVMMHTPKYHKQYPLQEGCISESVKAEKGLVQSSSFRKGNSGQPSTEFPSGLIAFSFTKDVSHKKLEKRSRSISPLRFPIRRSVSSVNQPTCPSFSVKLSASSVHRSISPKLSGSRQQQPPEARRSQSVYPQRQSTKVMEVYSKKTKNLFKALFSVYKSKKHNI
nr:cellulose synthase-like protein G3 [Tanacetum cinerariifolium]